MGWKLFFSFIFFIIVVGLLIFYWFIPLEQVEFGGKFDNPNFNMNQSDPKNMQFYSNMRYADSRISYKIHDCTLQKKYDMENAFEIISNKTILEFYPVNYAEEISVFCDNRNKIEGQMFIAGEGGPINITQTNNFNVISKGRILLIKDFRCEIPNVAIHELFHALGFDHSLNRNNIMYNITKCGQSIGGDIPYLINQLYSVPNYPDLAFENVSAFMRGKYLNAEMQIRNNGLKKSDRVKILVYADEKLVKEVELDFLDIGYGKIILLSNIWVKKISVDELRFVIDSDFDELDKANNLAVLKIKNK